jgi:hypothetical protein
MRAAVSSAVMQEGLSGPCEPVELVKYQFSASFSAIKGIFQAIRCSNTQGIPAYVEPAARSAFVKSRNKETSQWQTTLTLKSIVANRSRDADGRSRASYLSLQSLAYHSLAQAPCRLWVCSSRRKPRLSQSTSHHQISRTAKGGRLSASAICVSSLTNLPIQIGAISC